MPSAPFEFTPEITQNFYDKLARPIQLRMAQDIGSARSEALARGVEGDPLETSAVAAAKERGAIGLNDLYTGLNFDVANLARQERLILEDEAYKTKERQAQEYWQGQENAADRATRMRMAQMGFENQQDMMRTQHRYDTQGMVLKSLMGLGGMAAGFGMSKL